jgi:hypothetical protein
MPLKIETLCPMIVGLCLSAQPCRAAHDRVVRTIDFGEGKDGPAPSEGRRYAVEYKGRERLIVDRRTGRRVGGFASGYRFKGIWQISDDGRFYANWVYADASRGVGAGDLVVGDSRTGKVEVFRDPREYLFQPGGSRLAIFQDRQVVIYDCASRKKFTLKTPCISRRDSCWSPNGGYIAYLADMSPWTHDMGEPVVDSVRVISAANGKSVTILREEDECDWWAIDWTP